MNMEISTMLYQSAMILASLYHGNATGLCVNVPKGCLHTSKGFETKSISLVYNNLTQNFDNFPWLAWASFVEIT